MTIHNTLFVGKVLLHFSRLNSTNDYALKLLDNQTVIEGTVISTANQFKGKGQMGNQWESEANKNIAMSVVLKPTFLSPNQQFYLNIAISLAVRNTLEHFSQQKTLIKWSNDILINNRKIAGILIQNAINGNSLQSSIVGIGININQETFSNAPNASSLKSESNQPFDIEEVMQVLCKNIEQYYLQLKQGKYTTLRAAYFEHLFRYKEWSWYRIAADGWTIKGKIVDVLENGQLVIEHSNGRKIYQFKEIQFIY